MKRVLIANRGEIAVRVIRACKDHGLQSVAVYSEEDRNAIHAGLADAAYSLHGTTATQTYLNIEKLNSGIYFVKIKYNNTVVTKKIVKY